MQAVSDSNDNEGDSFSDLNMSAPKVETLNVSKIVDKGNGNKEISILTDVAEEKKDDSDEDSETKKQINI